MGNVENVKIQEKLGSASKPSIFVRQKKTGEYIKKGKYVTRIETKPTEQGSRYSEKYLQNTGIAEYTENRKNKENEKGEYKKYEASNSKKWHAVLGEKLNVCVRIFAKCEK